MASFREHVGFSSLLGVGYGVAAHVGLDFSPTQSALAGYLCGIGGMLPDLDSASGRPVREIFSLTAAVAPLVLIGRVLRATGLPSETETVILVMLVMYFLIRYGLAWLVNKFSKHRGMFHSIPAMFIAGEVIYLMYPSDFETTKLLMGSGIALGFFSHLFLDEVYAIKWEGMIPKFKKSFGTAMKMTGKAFGPTAFTYALFATMSFLVLQDAELIGPPPTEQDLQEAPVAAEPAPQPTALPQDGFNSPTFEPPPANDLLTTEEPTGFQEALTPQAELPDAPLFR